MLQRYGMHADRCTVNRILFYKLDKLPRRKETFHAMSQANLCVSNCLGKGCILLSIVIESISQKAFAPLDEFNITLTYFPFVNGCFLENMS